MKILQKLKEAFETDDGALFVQTKPVDNNETIQFSQYEEDLPMVSQAVRHGARKIFNYLLERNIDLNKKGSWNWSPLLEAVFRKDLESVECLIEHGADVEQMGGKATTLPLVEAAFSGDDRIVSAIAGKSTVAYLQWGIGNLESMGAEKYSTALAILKAELASRRI